MVRSLVLLAALVVATPFAATAQTYPDWRNPGVRGYDPIAATADQHRYEMERLRAQATERDALARRQQLQSRLTVLELQAARRSAPPQSAPPPSLRSPEEARRAGEAATPRQDVGHRVSEIDAWLDRPRP